jgi:hypothetical protein
MPERPDPQGHTLQCMEIWGGIEPVERAVSTPGLDLWVYSQPFEGDKAATGKWSLLAPHVGGADLRHVFGLKRV